LYYFLIYRTNRLCDGPTTAYRIHFTGEEDYT
jgi:hypothetical protein